MSRLEEIFTQNPALQTSGVMRQLLDVYKDCRYTQIYSFWLIMTCFTWSILIMIFGCFRYLDKLMGTTFFHESHFQGLLERVRERGRSNVAQRVADQVSRLFRSGESDDQTTSSTESTRTMDDSGCVTNNKDSSSSPSDSLTSAEFLLCENLANLERQVRKYNTALTYYFQFFLEM
jgi:ubiquitin-conjugating enzyme E2 O